MDESTEAEGPGSRAEQDQIWGYLHLFLPSGELSVLAEDLDSFTELVAMAGAITTGAAPDDRLRVFEAYVRFVSAVDHFREYGRAAENVEPGATYELVPGEPETTWAQIFRELGEDVNRARFDFLVEVAAANPADFLEAAAAVNPEAFQTLHAVPGEDTAVMLREALSQGEELRARRAQQRPDEIAEAFYQAVIDEIPQDRRDRVTAAYRSAQGVWLRYGTTASMETMTLALDQMGGELASYRPVTAKPLTGVRIDQLIRQAETSPAGQKLRRMLTFLERSAMAQTRRFFLEALAANPGYVSARLPVELRPELPALQRDADKLNRRIERKASRPSHSRRRGR